jgi:hypothetical protein
VLSFLSRVAASDTWITGWDLWGDLYLAYGPPAHLDLGTHVAYYLWGTPEAIGVGDGTMGRVETVRLLDALSDFVDTAARETRQRRRQARSARTTLTRVLERSTESGDSQVLETLLEQLHVLAPPPIYEVSLPAEAEMISLTMDSVGFPTDSDSVEVQTTFGVPTESLRLMARAGSVTTDLRTSLLVVDHDLEVIHQDVRGRGYVIEGDQDLEGRFFLDTFRFKVLPGSYVAYLSIHDPQSGLFGGLLENLDLSAAAPTGLRVSQILLSTDIRPTEESGKFVRGDSRVLPAPSRIFQYGQSLFFYFELSNLTRSEYNDYVREEAFYMIPEGGEEGVVMVAVDQEYTTIRPTVSRSMEIDLSSLSESYEGPVFLVALVTDNVSGEQAIGATRFTIKNPDPPPRP